jgi:hypothetical protein
LLDGVTVRLDEVAILRAEDPPDRREDGLGGREIDRGAREAGAVTREDESGHEPGFNRDEEIEPGPHPP